MYTFRFLLMLIFTLAATGAAVKILKQFKVNYMFIFELDPQYKITHVQLFRVSWLLRFILILARYNLIRNLDILPNVLDLHHKDGVPLRKGYCSLHTWSSRNLYLPLHTTFPFLLQRWENSTRTDSLEHSDITVRAREIQTFLSRRYHYELCSAT